jgi:hypothetical protein
MRITKRTARREALKNGYRSKFELQFSKKLETLKIKVQYETDKIVYIQPEKQRTYIPDWTIGKNRYIETKGRFTAQDRQKVLCVIKSNPKIKLYLLFQNAKVTLSKVSKTSYGDWCDKNNIEWADIKDENKWLSWIK